MLGEPTPHEADPTGSQYAFEKRVVKAGGGEGFAAVWKRDFFAWEYKGHEKDLKAAYVQLLAYKDDLGNPPVLVVSDLDRIEVRTNFTGLSPVLKVVTLDDLAADDPSEALGLLRSIFVAPEELRPRIEQAQITEKAARHFAEIAGTAPRVPTRPPRSRSGRVQGRGDAWPRPNPVQTPPDGSCFTRSYPDS